MSLEQVAPRLTDLARRLIIIARRRYLDRPSAPACAKQGSAPGRHPPMSKPKRTTAALRSLAALAPCAALAGLLMVACNVATGADDILLSDDDFGSTASGGVGGATSATSAEAAASSNGSAASSSSASASNASSTVASSTVASSSSGSNCMYPSGPYGVKEGDTVPSTLTWQGYRPGDSSPSTISIEEFFDCDGTKGINALMVETSQYG
jgi:hypothetical protein